MDPTFGKEMFLELSDQEHAPRIQIRFAVAEVRRPIIARLSALEARAGTSISRGSVSVQCLTKNGQDFLRAPLVPSEVRTVGEMNMDNALIAASMRRDSDSDTPMDITTEKKAALAGPVSPSCASIACTTCPRRPRT